MNLEYDGEIMGKVDFDDDDDLDAEIDVTEDITEIRDSGYSSLEVRRKLEDMVEAKRLRRELEDFYDD